MKILESATEERIITADLGLAKEYGKMPQTTLEARLEAREHGIISSDKKACERRKTSCNICRRLDGSAKR
ncbi:MAG: hypothetical protein LBQ40_02695, partial [Clostridiales bacterium]|nr:hypothetical protein [Clostridiales bacterium]